jgi:hypothetical protein
MAAVVQFQPEGRAEAIGGRVRPGAVVQPWLVER